MHIGTVNLQLKHFQLIQLSFLEHPHAENPPEVAACLQEISAGKTHPETKCKRDETGWPCLQRLSLASGCLVDISARARLEPRKARNFPKNLIKMTAGMC